VATIRIGPLELPGPWAEGYVLERQHRLSSEFLGYDSNGHPQFDTERSELGDLLFRLKNTNDRATLAPLAETAAAFVRTWGIPVDAVVPVPPSRRRAFQPVVGIVSGLAATALEAGPGRRGHESAGDPGAEGRSAMLNVRRPCRTAARRRR